MNESAKEIVGFLCRWSLLALMLGLLGLAGVGFLQATGAIGSEMEPELMLPDQIRLHRPERAEYLHVFADPPLRYKGAAVVAIRQGGRVRMCGPLVQNAYCRIDPEPGREEIAAVGNPFGALAFQRNPATMVTASAEEEVWIIDSDILLDLPRAPARSKPLRQLIGAVQSQGLAVVAESGTREEYAARRAAVREIAPDLPVVVRLRGRHYRQGAVRQIGRLFRRDGRKPPVVTCDDELAILAAREGHPVHLLTEGIGNPQEHPKIIHYRTLTQLVQAVER
ncbi:MAG: hypothetical protein ACLFVU_03980 [Phycisphaerae bacterium]